MTPPRAALFDFDDTLAEGWHPMLPDMAARIAALAERLPVAILSATSLERLEREFLAPLPAHTRMERLYLLPSNTSQCLLWRDGAWVFAYDVALTDEERALVRGALEQAVRETGILSDAPQYGERIEDRRAGMSLTALGIDAPNALKASWDPDRAKRDRLCAIIAPLLPAFETRIGGRTTIDITKKGFDKSYGVRWLAAHLRLEPKDMLYVGDSFHEGGNDAVVIPTGIVVRPVSGPEETARIIDELLAALP